MVGSLTDELTVCFRVLIKGADINMVYGRRYGLIGRNGIGKTTLLRTLAKWVHWICGFIWPFCAVMSDCSVLAFLPSANSALYYIGVAFVCISLTVKSLYLETSFLLCRYVFRMSRSFLYVKVIGSRSRSKEHCSMSVCALLNVLSYKLTNFIFGVQLHL